MLSSHKAVRPRGLHGSSTRSGIPNSPVISLQPAASTPYQSSKRRDFSWGAKHPPGGKNAGKVWKGFSTQDHTRARKQLYRGTFWNQYYTPHTRRYLPIQEWRLSSSWGRLGSAWTKSDQAPSSKTKAEEKEEEDWYSRYQLQKTKQYDEFMKKMEEDPIGMLFGRKWANWVDGAEAKFYHSSEARGQETGSASRNGWSTWDIRERSQTSSLEPLKGGSPYRKSPSQSQNVEGMTPGYEIDPITNRRFKKLDVTPKEPTQPDMIGMSKVSQKATSVANDQTHRTQQASDIPVKPFEPPRSNSSPPRTPHKDSSPSTNAEEASIGHKAKDSSGWLAQEGFGQENSAKIEKQSVLDAEVQNPKIADGRLESALDRHLQIKAFRAQSSDPTKLRYKPEEKKTEDVDLLRSSDVRASAGLRGKPARPAKESDAEKESRQRKLEDEYHNGSLRREEQLAQEVAKASQQESQNAQIQRQHGKSYVQTKKDVKPENSSVEFSREWVNNISDPPPRAQTTETCKPTVQASTNIKLDKIQAQIVPLKTRLDAVKADYDALRQRWLDEKKRKEEMTAKKLKEIHEAEIKSQKMAMEFSETHHGNSADSCGSSTGGGNASRGAGHNANNRSVTSLQSYIPGEGDMASNVHEFARRDRWYKKKAPHADQEMDTKLQRLVNDRALIREVRDIYEETYGTIDTKHRQTALDGDKPMSGRSLSSHPSHGISQPAQNAHAFNASVITSQSNPPPSPLKRGTQNSEDHTTSQTSQISKHSSSSDPLATVQRLFQALRQVQTVVQENRSYLQQLSNPTQSQMSSISESSNALAIIQKLFIELRRAQAVVQDQRADLEQPAELNGSITRMQALGESGQSAKDGASKPASNNQAIPEELPAKDFSDTTNVVDSAKLSDCHTTSGAKSINSDSEDVNAPCIYRILAFDSTQKKVISSETTSITPFSEEQRLLPAEALKILNNPGKFLPDLMALHNKGYVVVSGTGKTLILKKSATLAEVEQAEHEEFLKNLNPIDGTLTYQAGHPTLVPKGASTTPFSPEESSSLGKARNAQESEHPDPRQETPPAPEPVDPTSTDSATEPSSAPTSASNLPPSDKVRREETVFSGPARGNWHEAEHKRFTKKSKRAVKRSKRLKNMLWTGTLTAACCYAVGVISQMLQH